MDRLDLRLVEYFIAVAEELHFGRASERLHIAQPSLSQQIRRLEVQLGVTLLERNSRNVDLSPAGRAFLREGRKMLNQAQHAIQSTRAAAAPSVTVGFYGSSGSILLPNVLRVFGERHPSVTVSVRELLLGSLDDILNGSVDVAFTRLTPEQTELEVEILASEPRVVALALSHPLAGQRALTMADLANERFIINPAVQHEDDPPRWLAEQRRHGLPGQVAARASSLQEIITLVAAGRGVCLLPSTVAIQQPRADVTYVSVLDADPAVTSLAWRPGGKPPLVDDLIKSARDTAASSGTTRGFSPSA
jgi:DNA-binding transcriptional LysR family regulator